MNLREQMPQTAAFIDEIRAAFGAAEINAVIRAGLNGEPGFWARENGFEVGTRQVRAVEFLQFGPDRFRLVQ